MHPEWKRAAPITVAVFVSGGVLLGVEIAASRVLAPFFGNSLFVWGALIGVVLTGLAIGYWAGGALADRVPVPGLLVAVITAGAAGVLAIPLLDDHVLEAVVAWDPGPRADPVLAAILLFGWPSVLLAGVTPIAVRLRATELARMGRTAGRLFSVSTIGSIVGTFVTAFWLVPEFGVDQLLAFAAAALFAGATVVAVSQRLRLGVVATVAACGAALAIGIELAPETGGTLSRAEAQDWSPVWRLRERPTGSSATYYGGKILFRKDTQYHRLAVVQTDDSRELRFDSSFQSAMDLRDPYKTEYRYTDYLQLGLAYNPSARNVLVIGLGGGSAPKRMWRDFPNLHVEVVELDPVVVDVAHRFFRVPEDELRLRIDVEDGRRFLQRDDRRWDVIAIDTYFADAIPFHMATREFVELARSRLTPSGVIVANIIGAIAGDGSKLFRSMFRTYGEFPTVVVHPVSEFSGESVEDVRNLILVATNESEPSEASLLERWRRRKLQAPTAPDLRKAIRDRYDGVVSAEGVPTLTDDYAPTDALLLE